LDSPLIRKTLSGKKVFPDDCISNAISRTATGGNEVKKMEGKGPNQKRKKYQETKKEKISITQMLRHFLPHAKFLFSLLHGFMGLPQQFCRVAQLRKKLLAFPT